MGPHAAQPVLHEGPLAKQDPDAVGLDTVWHDEGGHASPSPHPPALSNQSPTVAWATPGEIAPMCPTVWIDEGDASTVGFVVSDGLAMIAVGAGFDEVLGGDDEVPRATIDVAQPPPSSDAAAKIIAALNGRSLAAVGRFRACRSAGAFMTVWFREGAAEVIVRRMLAMHRAGRRRASCSIE